MRKIVVTEYITLDGVIQAPGGPEPGMQYGGWSAAYYDPIVDEIAEKQKKPAKDFLLGRKTFETFASFFPTDQGRTVWPGNDDITKYVVSASDVDVSVWKNSVHLKGIEDIKKLKEQDGTDIQVSGSGVLIQALLKEDLVDEIWLLIHPVTLGEGRKLFAEGTIPAAFKLVESKTTPSGVAALHYVRDGNLKLGMMGS